MASDASIVIDRSRILAWISNDLERRCGAVGGCSCDRSMPGGSGGWSSDSVPCDAIDAVMPSLIPRNLTKSLT